MAASLAFSAAMVVSVETVRADGGAKPVDPAAGQHATRKPTSRDLDHEEGLWLWQPAPLTEPLVTDRPDFTESTDAVPRGHFQLEMGYTFSYDREGKERRRDHTTPELLLRIGLLDDFELRIGWDGYAYTNSLFEGETRRGRSVLREDWTQGAQDLSLGFKYKFFDQAGVRPHFGIIGAISVPSGSAATTSGDVDPEVVLLWAYDLNDRLSVAGNVGLGVPAELGERFFQTSASLAGAFAITDKLGTYVEYFGFYPNAKGSGAAHALNGGFTYLITDNFQIDVRAGFGLNEEADDFFSGIGLSWRW